MASLIPAGVRTAAITAGLWCAGFAAALPVYTVTDLGRGTSAYAINNAGQVTLHLEASQNTPVEARPREPARSDLG